MYRKIGVEFMYEVLSGLYLTSVVVLFWRHTITASLLLGAGLGIWLWRYRNKADAAAMVGAALLGTPSEIICVKYGVWTHSLADKIWPGRKSLSRKIVFGLLAGVIVVYYIMISIAIIRSIAIVYTVIMLITVIFWHEERDILIFITGGMLGTFGEYICMQQGFWHYHFPHFISIGLPVSLPMAWGLSAIIIGRIAKIWEVDA
jgi:hypothetical protein